jgi:hypothetical protein
MKIAEDQGFSFAFVWIVTNAGEKGWATHYRPKNPPLSAEIESVFRFLKLDTFAECPHFNFDPCFWRFTPYESRGDSVCLMATQITLMDALLLMQSTFRQVLETCWQRMR